MTRAVVQLDLPVVRFDLRRDGVEAQAQRLDERPRQFRPVDVGLGGDVRRPGAGGTRELREVLPGVELTHDALEAPREHADLLAHGGGRGGLAVRAREHRGVAVLLRELGEGGGDRAELRQPHALDRALHGQGVGGGVDVFARAGEVGQLGEGGEAQGVEAVAHEVLDGLDVVAGDRLFLFQPGDLVGAELLVQGAQARTVGVGDGGGAEERAVGEGEQPLDLDLETRARLVRPPTGSRRVLRRWRSSGRRAG